MLDEVRLFVDETSFRLNGVESSAEITTALDLFVLLLQKCRAQGSPIALHRTIFAQELVAGVTLADLLYRSGSIAVDKNTIRALQVTLQRCVEWDDVSSDDSAIVRINGISYLAPTIFHVHGRAGRRNGAACLCLNTRADRRALSTVAVGGVERAISFVSTSEQLLGFYRRLPELENMRAAAFMANAGFAFPELAFVPELEKQFSRFSQHYDLVRPLVTMHLGVLNDHFRTIFNSSPEPARVQAELGGHGIDASPESPRTRSNKKAIKTRDVAISFVVRGGTRFDLPSPIVVRCEWHTKLAPDRDRIHFHPGPVELDGGVLIGIFHAHLPT